MMKYFVLSLLLGFSIASNANLKYKGICSCEVVVTGGRPAIALLHYFNADLNSYQFESWFWLENYGYPTNPEAHKLAREACLDEARGLRAESEECGRFIEFRSL